jgi:hypothetical protein
LYCLFFVFYCLAVVLLRQDRCRRKTDKNLIIRIKIEKVQKQILAHSITGEPDDRDTALPTGGGSVRSPQLSHGDPNASSESAAVVLVAAAVRLGHRFHHAVEVEAADVIPPDDENVGLLLRDNRSLATSAWLRMFPVLSARHCMSRRKSMSDSTCDNSRKSRSRRGRVCYLPYYKSDSTVLVNRSSL